MRCPHCRSDIGSPDPSYRECATCGGAHRVMEPCPEKPGFFQLIGMWLEGERPAEAYVAVSGSCLILVLTVAVVIVAAQRVTA